MTHQIYRFVSGTILFYKYNSFIYVVTLIFICIENYDCGRNNNNNIMRIILTSILMFVHDQLLTISTKQIS